MFFQKLYGAQVVEAAAIKAESRRSRAVPTRPPARQSNAPAGRGRVKLEPPSRSEPPHRPSSPSTHHHHHSARDGTGRDPHARPASAGPTAQRHARSTVILLKAACSADCRRPAGMTPLLRHCARASVGIPRSRLLLLQQQAAVPVPAGQRRAQWQ